MFFLANLVEVNTFALKEEVCVSNIKSLANEGSRGPPSYQGGSWWQSVVQCLQHSLGFVCGLCSDHDGVAARAFSYELLSSSF